MNAPSSPLLESLCGLATSLSPGALAGLCQALEGLPPDASLDLRLRAATDLSQPGARARAREVIEVWNREGAGISPAGIAWALRAAAHVDNVRRGRQSVELVWTGPTPSGSGMRRTDQALLDLVEGAQRDLIVVTFAAYRVPDIRDAIRRAHARGARVTLVVESRATSGGRMEFGAAEGIGADLASIASIYVWPLDRRPRDEESRTGSLHVKCAVADDSVLLLSSANLTEFAMRLNMELGLLIRGGDEPRRVADHLRSLMAEGVLVPAEGRARP